MSERLRIHVSFDEDDPASQIVAGEFLWVEALDGRPDHYRVNNIPFYADHIAIGDVVHCVGSVSKSPNCTHPDGNDCSFCTAPEFLEVIENAGNQTGLLAFETHLSPEEQKKISEHVQAAGGKVEWAHQHMLAFDAPFDKTIRELVGPWLDNGWAICSLSDAEET